jgi:hypothetical protein
MALSEEDIKKYLEYPIVCPFCGGFPNWDAPRVIIVTVLVSATCDACGKSWCETYKLESIKEILDE